MQAQWLNDGELMGFKVLEGIWRTITGAVVRATDVDLGSEGRISFRLKRKDDLLYVVMVFKLAWATHYYPMDMGDLRNLEGVLRATKKRLETPQLDALVREQEGEMIRLGILERTWRWAADMPLWKEDMFFTGGGRISFQIRRRPAKRCEIVFGSGEDTFHLPIQPDGLEKLEDALIKTKAALENSRRPAR